MNILKIYQRCAFFASEIIKLLLKNYYEGKYYEKGL